MMEAMGELATHAPLRHVALSLGANLGNREEMLRRALELIAANPAITLLRTSSMYASEPVGYIDQPEFINLAATASTTLSPDELLLHLRAIELQLGRRSRERWHEREIDIDIILIDSLVVSNGTLTVPHPEMHRRRFVLLPLAEIAPDLWHPLLHKTVGELLAECQDNAAIQRVETGRRGEDPPEGARASLPAETLPSPLGLIAIEGVIGAGKTTLARMLSRRLNARLMLERFEENPFLEGFYRDRERFAFQTQIFFLLSRYRQQQELRQPDLFHQTTVSDYIFDKDRIFASLTLGEHELKLYESVALALGGSIIPPDLVIYLQSSVDRLAENIRKRGREMEEGIDLSYLEALSEAYTHYFARYTSAPLLIVNTGSSDFINDASSFNGLVDAITRSSGARIRYFEPSNGATDQ